MTVIGGKHTGVWGQASYVCEIKRRGGKGLTVKWMHTIINLHWRLFNMSRNISLSNDLRTEVNLLKSFTIGVAGKDPEGEYRPEFVKKILAAIKEKPRYRFS